MESFEILWKGSAEREIRRIDPPQISRLVTAVDSLSKNPFPTTCCKLEGAKSIYRIPVGDYRIVYGVESKERRIIIYHIRHRKDVYRNI